MGMAYALISMAFAGVNDFLFKQYTMRPQPRVGWFMAGVGLAWTALCALGLWLLPTPSLLAHWPVTLGAGICSFVANVFFIRSYRVFPAGTGATVFRLNLVLVVLFSVLWLGEALTSWKVIGVVCGIAAVLVLGYQSTAGKAATNVTLQSVLMLLGACCCRAGMGLLYKVAGMQSEPAFELLTVNGVCWLLGGALYALWTREQWVRDGYTPRFALTSGVLVVGIAFFMQAATRIADASLAIPVTQMSFIVTSALGITLRREPVTRGTVWALLAAVGCIMSMSRG